MFSSDDLDYIIDMVGETFMNLRSGRLFLTVGEELDALMLASLTRANRRLGLGAEAAAVVAAPASFRQRHPELAIDPALEILHGTAADFTYPQGCFTHAVHRTTAFTRDDQDQRRRFDLVVDGARRATDFAYDAGVGAFLLLTDRRSADAVSADQRLSHLAAEAAEALGLRVGEEAGGPVVAVASSLASAVQTTARAWRELLAKPAASRRAVFFTASAAEDGGPVRKSRTFVIDVDGVAAKLAPGNDYRLSQPIPEVIAAINRLYDAGHRIVMMTARGSATGIDWEAVTRRQFADWGLRHHELRFGKPAADYYVDDRMATVEMLCAMADGRPFPPSTRAPRATAACDGAQEARDELKSD